MIYSFSQAHLETKSQIWPYIYIQPTKSASLVLHFLKTRGHVHNCPFESIWFAISQPLCLMYMSNIYIHFMQISHVSCIWPIGCPCLFILNTRHNSIEGISFARDLLVTVNPVSSPVMFSCFEIEIGFLNLPQLMFQVVFRHEFSLIGKFNVYICETLSPTTVVAVGVIWILAGNWLTMVTSISRYVLLSWHRPHTKKSNHWC